MDPLCGQDWGLIREITDAERLGLAKAGASGVRSRWGD